MKIVGFTQHRNELSKGNLHNWLKCMDVCDLIYVYDQGSDDGSLEILRANPKCRLIESPTNNFANENFCKKELLDKLLRENPDTSWIFWMDCDYILDARTMDNDFRFLKDTIAECDSEGVESIVFNHFNLWRSDCYFRTDDDFHSLNDEGRSSLWKNNGRLRYNPIHGLHKSPLPSGLGKSKRVEIDLLHRGFSTDYQIITKYKTYKSFGQSGWALERIISEKGLTVERLPDGKLPEWFLPYADLSDPMGKERLDAKQIA